MDGTVLALFLISTLLGGVTTGLAGFAMGLVVSGVWLHIMTPAQTAALIVGYGLIVQTYSIWKMRHTLKWLAVIRSSSAARSACQSAPPLLPTSMPATSAPASACCGDLQQLFPVAAQGSCHSRHRPRRNRCRIRQWDFGWADRPLRPGHHHVVPIAWLVEGRAARNLPAGDPGGFRHDGRDADDCRHGDGRTGQDLCLWFTGADRRHVVRLEGSTDISTMPRFAKSSWCCCCCPAWC